MVKGGIMTRQIGLLTLICCFLISGNAMAQREVPPPSNTPLNEPSAISQTKPAAKPVQSAKTPEKAKKNALPAPVQAAAVPTITEPKTAPAEKKPEKTNKNAKTATAKPSGKKPGCEVTTKPPEKKPASAKKQKSVRICETNASKSQHKVAQAKKDSVKTANKSTNKRAIRATTVPLE
jgi:hypothetical protein